ncbi:hypothetical protein GPECTOR_8g203 [Gonium pectorale]|uniref:Uncharacterized protein n=1 Tax=Gonium pectorale TaxID=33097 RepID=A0A150GSG4_GONPE|nr:hypothetical protein GPECTOR_8g203 [Gonium pectorale]|eukprot:KXZ52819.1 hypothetical protein GPECTOR_8g203 [Gonium pectorale]
MLADESDEDDEVDTGARRHRRGSRASDVAGEATEGSGPGDASDDDNSSSDELEYSELERMGLSPLSIPESLCRTPVDDVIAEMLEDSTAEREQRGEGKKAEKASPVPFRGMLSAVTSYGR